MEGDAGPPGLSGEPGKQGFRVSFSRKPHQPYEAFSFHTDERRKRSRVKTRDIPVCCSQCVFVLKRCVFTSISFNGTSQKTPHCENELVRPDRKLKINKLIL